MSRPLLPLPLRQASGWAWRLLVLAAVVYVVLLLLSKVALVTYALVAALLVTALLHPAVDFLDLRGVPRTLATVLVFILGLAAIAGVIYFVVQQVSSNAGALGAQANNSLTQIRDWLSNGPLHIKASQLNRGTQSITDSLRSHGGTIASGAVSTAGTVVEVVSGVLVAAFATFFLLRDGAPIWGWLVRMFPGRVQRRVHAAGEVAWHTLSGYVRGTVIVALVDAIVVTIVLLVVRVPLALPLGVLIFLGAFIPLVGLTVTGALATLVTLVTHGLGAALVVLVAIVVTVQLEGHVLQPVVMSRAVRIHPLGIILAVTSGTLVGGIGGALIAVPLVAIINNVITHRTEEATAPAEQPGG